MINLDLPPAWEVVRAKFLFRKLQIPPPDDTGVVTAFRDGEVTLRENRRTEGFTFASKEIGYQGVRPGDLVIHAMDAFAGAIGVSDSYGKCSPVYSVCEPLKEIDVRYYAYLLRDFALSGRIASLTQGIRERSTDFRFKVFGELRLPYLPLAQQQSIANFLDRQTSRIDTLIEKKKRLIELLEEKRTALITRAVTKGLDPDVRMKDSGVEWLGEIPEHWAARRLKTLASIRPSNVDKKTRTGEERVRLCNYTDVYHGDRIENGEGLMEASASPVEIARFKLRSGDVIITKDSESPDDIAVPAYVAQNLDDVICGYHLDLIRPKEREVEGRFLYYSFLSSRVSDQFSVVASGVTRYSLSVRDVAGSWFPCPPLSEQKEIAAYIDDFTARESALRHKVNKAITLLQEYRTALISAAVTGKIDVRDHPDAAP